MTTTTPEVAEHVVDVWEGTIRLRVKVCGSGPALVYLHPSAGLAWDPFLERLAEEFTIYAPEFPGTSPEDPRAIHNVHDLWQAVLMYEEALRGLGLDRPILVGQSFGGMLASELAATYPDRFSRLVLLDPIGLWRDEMPVANWISAPPSALPEMLFADPHGPAAAAMMTPPEDPEAAVAAGAALVWSLGCTGKFMWPIPDRGLESRLHRISAPTQIIWGEKDRLISSAYAELFAAKIADSTVVIIPGSGHIPQVEQTDRTFDAVRPFLAAGSN